MINLISNACEAYARRPDMMPPGERVIRVDGWAEPTTVHLLVHDTAGGIREDLLPRVFEPFFTTKPVGQGTGLGLSMAYGIIADLGGCISVRNVDGGAESRSPSLARRRRAVQAAAGEPGRGGAAGRATVTCKALRSSPAKCRHHAAPPAAAPSAARSARLHPPATRRTRRHRHGHRRRLGGRAQHDGHRQPGTSLMIEFIGLGYYAEIPAVSSTSSASALDRACRPALAERPPPTALLSHGDTKHLMFFPSSVRECFRMSRTPSISPNNSRPLSSS